jgi:hypothetical protein
VASGDDATSERPGTGGAAEGEAEGWTSAAPREEIRLDVRHEPDGGRRGSGGWVIETDGREGLDGWWERSFSVTGGRHYRFQAFRRVENVASPRRSAMARLLWLDDSGRRVPEDRNLTDAFAPGQRETAGPEHLADGPADADGRTEVGGVYQAPRQATRLRVELHLTFATHFSDAHTRRFGQPAPQSPRPSAEEGGSQYLRAIRL